MKIALLVLMLVAIASANTFTVSTGADGVSFVAGQPPPPPAHCTGTGACSSTSNAAAATASSTINTDPSSQGTGLGFPIAQISLFSLCPSFADFSCGAAAASASFSFDLTIEGPTGALGLLDIGPNIRNFTFASTSFSVGLPLVASGRWEFVFGQPFTVSGGISGACSECSTGIGTGLPGSIGISEPLLVYDLSGDLLYTLQDPPNQAGQLFTSAPEPGAWILCGLGLLSFRLARRFL